MATCTYTCQHNFHKEFRPRGLAETSFYNCWPLSKLGSTYLVDDVDSHVMKRYKYSSNKK